MSTPRLYFLYTRISRGSPKSTIANLKANCSGFLNKPHRAQFSSSGQRCIPEAATSRYGTANEPPAHLGGGRGIPPSPSKVADQKKLPDPAQEEEQAKLDPPRKSKQGSSGSDSPAEEKDSQHRKAREADPEAVVAETQVEGGTSPSYLDPPGTPQQRSGTTSSASKDAQPALNNVLNMQPPSDPVQDQPPHLTTPPFIHHFDSYTLVKDLTASGAFTDQQAVTIMKALRAVLAENMELAHEALMSRSDAEMDGYQFRAASSELRTEIRQKRNATSEQMRADRTQLQHEVDILSQRVSQESLNLKDELKGMFDDRKMNVRTERRIMDNRIQEMGHKITVAMNSGMRNEIEGLRFLVTRNAALTLGAFIVGSLMVLYLSASKKSKDEKAEMERRDREKEERRARERGEKPTSSQEELVKRVEQGADPALVSLG